MRNSNLSTIYRELFMWTIQTLENACEHHLVVFERCQHLDLLARCTQYAEPGRVKRAVHSLLIGPVSARGTPRWQQTGLWTHTRHTASARARLRGRVGRPLLSRSRPAHQMGGLTLPELCSPAFPAPTLLLMLSGFSGWLSK